MFLVFSLPFPIKNYEPVSSFENFCKLGLDSGKNLSLDNYFLLPSLQSLNPFLYLTELRMMQNCVVNQVTIFSVSQC